MPKLFWRSRFRAIWGLLTCKYFAVMVCRKDNGSDLMGYYSVSHPSFLFMTAKLGPAIEGNEGQAAALRQAKEILNDAK